MAKVSLGRLIASVAVVAFGCAVFAFPIYWLRCHIAQKGGPPIGMLLEGTIYLAGAAIVGAGFGNILKRPGLGAILGACGFLAATVLFNILSYWDHVLRRTG